MCDGQRGSMRESTWADGKVVSAVRDLRKHKSNVTRVFLARGKRRRMGIKDAKPEKDSERSSVFALN